MFVLHDNVLMKMSSWKDCLFLEHTEKIILWKKKYLILWSAWTDFNRRCFLELKVISKNRMRTLMLWNKVQMWKMFKNPYFKTKTFDLIRLILRFFSWIWKMCSFIFHNKLLDTVLQGEVPPKCKELPIG